MTSSCEEFAALVGPLAPRVTPLTSETCLFVLPVEGLDSHPIHFYASREGTNWRLNDLGHVVSDLTAFGVARDRIVARLESLSGEFPISLVGDDIGVWLPTDNDVLARQIMSRAMTVVLGVWMLRADQPLPAERTHIAARLARRIREIRPNTFVKESATIPGASRIERRFDLQVGPAERQGYHLVRTADTQNRTQLRQSAELYLVYADDLRRLPSLGERWRFFFVWNDMAADLDRRVYSELDEKEIRPIAASEMNEAAERILLTVPA